MEGADTVNICAIATIRAAGKAQGQWQGKKTAGMVHLTALPVQCEILDEMRAALRRWKRQGDATQPY